MSLKFYPLEGDLYFFRAFNANANVTKVIRSPFLFARHDLHGYKILYSDPHEIKDEDLLIFMRDISSSSRMPGFLFFIPRIHGFIKTTHLNHIWTYEDMRWTL